MSNLSTALRPKMLIRVDTYGKLVEGVKNIYLTQEEANFISTAWASSVYAHWTDRITGDVKMILNRNDWRMEDSQVQPSSKVMKWICDYGVRHFMHESCICDHHYTCQEMNVGIALNFLEWCRKRFPHVAPELPADITERMRDEFLKEKTLTPNQK